MQRAITAWLAEEGSNARFDSGLIKRLRLPYTVYGCMLLLSHNAFQSDAWKHVLATSPTTAEQRLYAHLCQHLKVTHIAITNPIPPTTTANTNSADQPVANIIRSPTNFHPLHGDFGPSTAFSPPTASDFASAFWVTAKQNGIYQTWAPHWTMFSRGNISEKARLTGLDSIKRTVEEGRQTGRGCAAVDLYAGIGYFAFSYLKAGVGVVLCWDLNAWSCEGLRRGAGANGWGFVEYGEVVEKEGARLVVFCEGNERAGERIARVRDALPPVRHVNCGLLPTSKGSWRTAVEVLDPAMGGWVHVHENFGVGEIEEKAEKVREAFQILLGEKREGIVELEHVNRLKSYAPGVMHCVLDIYVPPQAPG